MKIGAIVLVNLRVGTGFRCRGWALLQVPQEKLRGNIGHLSGA